MDQRYAQKFEPNKSMNMGYDQQSSLNSRDHNDSNTKLNDGQLYDPRYVKMTPDTKGTRHKRKPFMQINETDSIFSQKKSKDENLNQNS